MIVVLEKEENTLFSRMAVELSSMAESLKRTKTEGYKENFAKICETFKTISDIRVILRKGRAQKAKLEQAKLDQTQCKGETTKEREESLVVQIKATEKRVMEALLEVKSRLDGQNEILKALAEWSDWQENICTPQVWSEVVRITKKNKEAQRTDGDKKDRAQSKRKKTRPITIIVRRGEYLELLKKFREKASSEVTGMRISKMRETKNRNLLIEVNGDKEAANMVRLEVERSMGPGISVRTTSKNVIIEIRDPDEVTTADTSSRSNSEGSHGRCFGSQGD